MGSNGDVAEMADTAVEHAFQELSKLEKDFAAVEIDTSMCKPTHPPRIAYLLFAD